MELAVSECINGYEYSTSRATEIAVANYLDFPERGDQVNRALYRDVNGKYFVVERFSSLTDASVIPWTKKDTKKFFQCWALRKSSVL